MIVDCDLFMYVLVHVCIMLLLSIQITFHCARVIIVGWRAWCRHTTITSLFERQG